jgi:hypothetical protein
MPRLVVENDHRPRTRTRHHRIRRVGMAPGVLSSPSSRESPDELRLLMSFNRASIVV